MPGKRMLVHVHDGTVLRFTSQGSGDDQLFEIHRYSLYHVDDTIE